MDINSKRNQIGWVTVFILFSLLIVGCGSGKDAFENEFSYSGVDKLTVEGDFFDINISGDSRETLDVEVELSDVLKNRGVRVVHEKKGAEVIVRVEKPKVLINLSQSTASVIRIKAPVDTGLDVNTSSGSTAISGIFSDSLNLRTSSGNANLSDSGGEIFVSSSSGNIVVDSSDGSKELSSSSGNISVFNSKGDIAADSSSGEQKYDGIVGAIASESSSGDLRGTEITITDDSSFRSSSGSIDFDFSNDISDFTFDLKSSSGNISAGDTKAEGNLSTGRGDIKVKGTSSSGRQSYK
jgi:hypothetical protein